MSSDRPKRAVPVALLLLLLVRSTTLGQEFSDEGRVAEPAEGAGTASRELTVTMSEERRLLVEDPANRFRLSLPGPYWECKSRSQIAAGTRQQGPGCGSPTRLPPGLLLVAHNKDAPVQAILYLVPERFLLRSGDDLERYVSSRLQQMQPRRGAVVEFQEASYEKDGELIVHRAPLSLSAGGQEVRALLVHYFVRPRGEDVHVYRMEIMAAEEEFEREQEEMTHIAGSFAFTGELSEEFFAPDAPDEKLPDLAVRPGGAPACGQGYWPMVLAAIGVLLIYMYMRKRAAKARV